MYEAAVDPHAADWIVARLGGLAESVLSLVPAGFSEYLRIFHPAYTLRTGGLDGAVTWAEIARANGTYIHAGAQLGAITRSERYEWEGQPSVFDRPPETGNLPRELLDAVSRVLARRTSTPGSCYFAVWEGWGCGTPPEVRSAPTFSVPGRTYHLLTGPVDAVYELADAWQPPRSPSLWWPQDHTWCVATEVDLKTTYIGADHSCAQEVISLAGVEAATVPPDLGIDWLSDTLNPRQTSP